MKKSILSLTLCLTLLFTFTSTSFALVDGKDNNIITPMDYSTDDVFGDWEIVEHLGTTSTPYEENNLANNVALGILGFAPGNAVPTFILMLANELITIVDFEEIGGVYQKSYYVRQIVYPEHKDLNVPVLYQFAYFTIYYNTPYMRNVDIEYIDIIHDGPARLASN